MMHKCDFKISIRNDLNYFFLFLIFYQSCLSQLSSANAFKLKPQLSFTKITTKYDGKPFEITQPSHQRNDDVTSRNDDADEVKDTFKQLDILLHKVEDEGYKISDVDEEFEEMLEEVEVEGYTFYHAKGCTAQDDIFNGVFDESDIDECKMICDNDDDCVSFEYWGQGNPDEKLGEGVCHVSSTCTAKVAQDQDKTGLHCNLYVKKSATDGEKGDDDEKDHDHKHEEEEGEEEGNGDEGDNGNKEEGGDGDEEDNGVIESCYDGKKNQDETGIDCGGSCKLCGHDFNNPMDSNWKEAQGNLPA